MPDEVYTDEFHKEHKMQMDDKFYTISNYILKEALQMAELNLKDLKHVPRDRVGVFVANLGEPL